MFTLNIMSEIVLSLILGIISMCISVLIYLLIIKLFPTKPKQYITLYSDNDFKNIISNINIIENSDLIIDEKQDIKSIKWKIDNRRAILLYEGANFNNFLRNKIIKGDQEFNEGNMTFENPIKSIKVQMNPV